jgi:hypothetical protein
MRNVVRPLIVTGAPAVGKSTAGSRLARARRRAAFVDVDDVRHFVVAGHVAPWQGDDGLRQQRLGVENACAVARRFGEEGFDVVVADVVTPATIALYRSLLPHCLVVRLLVTRQEARRRAATRPLHLTAAEFAYLHDQERDRPPAADHDLEVSALTVEEQTAALDALWCS